MKAKTYDPRKVKLTPDEQAFEDSLDMSKLKNKLTPERKKGLIARAKEMSKDSRINVRLPGLDLEALKALAAKLGIPYQTLVASLIHRYVTDQLVDVDEARKVLQVTTPKEKKRA